MPKKSTKAVTNKKTETIETKDNTAKEVEVKPVAKLAEKKTATKPATKKVTEPVAKKETVKPVEKKTATKPAAKKATVKKTVEKKVEAKPAEKKETVKATEKKTEVKSAVKKVAAKKPVEKKSAAKKATKPAVKKETAAKKPATKKVTKPVAKKETVKKPAAKKVTTKSATKKSASKKVDQYNKLSLDTCFDLLRSMGVELSHDDIVKGLMVNTDVSKFSEELVEKYNLKDKYKFEEDGYDEDLVYVVVQKVYDTADVKPTSVEDLKADIDQAMAYTFVDETKDGQEYNRQFDIMRKVLVVAQNKDVHDSKILDDEINVDTEKFIVEFMDLAYKVLKTWKYEDVDYYEHFIFAVLSQFENLHKLYHNRIMMDVADLYILHGDYGLGDADYGYILRENQIKDYIYYRYASVYEAIDFDKAKQIASSALQFVDDRYTYYPNIIAILEK